MQRVIMCYMYCNYQRKHFSPFVLSVDGMIGKEALVVLATLSLIMAVKMEESILRVKGWVNGRIKIAVTRSYSWIIRGYWVPSLLWTQEPDWESGLGLVFVQ